MKFSIVIPTYKREKDLNICLDSVLSQSLFPDEVIIIDDDSLPSDFINRKKERLESKNIKFVYYKKDHPRERRGLSESKNIAIKISSNEIFFILDDDLILDNDFFEKIMEVWMGNEDENLIGVGGIIKNNRIKSGLEKAYEKIFGLSSSNKWDVNGVAFQVWDESITKRSKGYYVHGGASSYKKSLIKELGGFTTFSGGRTALEDVDFCLRAKNEGYYFIMEPQAKVIHEHSDAARESDLLIGFKETQNRKVIFKNNCKKNIKSYLWFYWANFGWILKQLLRGNGSRGLGMVRGLLLPPKQ